MASIAHRFIVKKGWKGVASVWAVASCLAASAQLEAPLVQDTIRVRSHGMIAAVDSLWADSLWVWDGPCDGPERAFRFELGDTAFCSATVPCTAIESAAATALNAPLLGADAEPLAWTWSVEARLTAEFILALPRESLSASCYPPLSVAEFDRILEAIDSALFESDKCSVVERVCREHCLSSAQRSEALQRIPSEDRRLETLTKISGAGTNWTEAELRGLFQLNFILEQALKRFANR